MVRGRDTVTEAGSEKCCPAGFEGGGRDRDPRTGCRLWKQKERQGTDTSLEHPRTAALPTTSL